MKKVFQIFNTTTNKLLPAMLEERLKSSYILSIENIKN